MALGTRLGTVFGSRLGTKFPADAGGAAPPAFSGVLDDIAAAGDTINVALSISHQLDKDYSGALIRVREAGGGTQADIPFDATTHMLDLVALAAHCGANDGFVVTVYDQSGNARDYTNATDAEQPKIYDGATGVSLIGSLPVALLDGGAGGLGNGDGWTRGDAAGYSGSQAVSIFCIGSFTDVATYGRVMVQLGPAGANTSYNFRHVLADNIGANTNQSSTLGSYRTFTPVTAIGTLSDYRCERDATGANNTTTLAQRGAALTVATTSGAAVGAIGTTASAIGANVTQQQGVTGVFNCFIGLNAQASAGAATAENTFGATVRTLAGV